VAVTGMLLMAIPAAAQDAAQRVAAHLQNGEFAPALAAARQAAPGQRDQLLTRIAAAQAQVGNRFGAIDTMADMTSDMARADALSGVADRPMGNFGAGGAGQADFESLIELIKNTIAKDTWDDQGGLGAVEEFEGGVRVDARGVVHSLLQGDTLEQLNSFRQLARIQARSDNSDARRDAGLRNVSLNRLEKHVQLKLAAGKPLDDEVRYLAGLNKITHVLVYPESGDIVLAGPAGDWIEDREGRVVSARTGRPVLHLDDLVVVLRHMTSQANAPFGCSIVPLQDNL